MEINLLTAYYLFTAVYTTFVVFIAKPNNKSSFILFVVPLIVIALASWFFTLQALGFVVKV